MGSRTILATLPGSAPFQRLEVALEQRPDGRLVIDLRDQHFAEGIGWFDQRRMTLDPRQFQQLQAVLGLKSAALDAAAQEMPATIPFPGPRSVEPSRTAAEGV
jgi:hypothetical protein